MPTGLSTHEKLAALHGYDLALLKELQEFQVLDAQAVLSVKIYLAGEESIKVNFLSIDSFSRLSFCRK